MLVKMKTAPLAEWLKKLLVVADLEATVPAYTNVLFTFAGGVAKLLAYNSLVGMFECTISEVTGDEGALLLPIKRLAEIVPYLAAPECTISTDAAVDQEGSSNVTFKCARYKGVLRSRPASEFTNLMAYPTPEEQITVFSREALLSLTERVKDAVPKDGGKYTVPVGLLEFNEGAATFVGTTGYVLAKTKTDGTFRTPTGAVPENVTIPKTAFSFLPLLTGALITFYQTENAIFFKSETELLGILQIPATFPKYNAVIPTAQPVLTISLKLAALTATIGRMAATTEKEIPLIVFSVTPTGAEISPLELSTNSKAIGAATDVIDVKAVGAPGTFVLNIDYLKGFIDHAGENVEIEFITPKTAIKLSSGADFLFYIAPAALD